MEADFKTLETGHILAVKIEDGTESLAWVEDKKWTVWQDARYWSHSMYNSHTKGAQPHVRVVWLKAIGPYTRAWHTNTYQGEVVHPYEASFPEVRDADGKTNYGNVRLLSKENVLALPALEWTYGDDRYSLIKRTVARAYGIEEWMSDEDRVKVQQQRELAARLSMIPVAEKPIEQLDLWAESAA
jgi:hypothetical protein